MKARAASFGALAFAVPAQSRKHGIAEPDMLHALRHPLATRRLDPDDGLARTLLLGADRAGNLLGDSLIHAMRLRPRYHDLFQAHGD